MTSETAEVRKRFANAGRAQRSRKAAKLIAIIQSRRPLAGCAVLDVGAGSGLISQALAEAVGPMGRVVAVDKTNSLAELAAVEFSTVTGPDLPFADATFDVAVSNHVIEHVGEEHEQRRHLQELHRVLKPSGLLYLACPSKWALMEPHYHLPFLSWLPLSLASAYLRASGRGEWYDCAPLSRSMLRKMLVNAGFAPKDVTTELLRRYAALEAHGASRVLLVLAAKLGVGRMPNIPTYAFVATVAAVE